MTDIDNAYGKKKAVEAPLVSPSECDGVNFVAYFTHWRTGKILYAADYGLKGFPIPKSGKRKK